METMDFFFQAVTQQALDRANGVVPDLDSYIALRRDTSGCKPCWALIEYAYNLDIPEEVMEHPTILALGEAANDLVTWSNVCPPTPVFSHGPQLTACSPCRPSSLITWNNQKVNSSSFWILPRIQFCVEYSRDAGLQVIHTI